MDWKPLITAALEAREGAYAPYSEFLVGAALLTEDGTMFQGCNVENRSYGLCICAERNAVSTAVAAGHSRFQAVAVATGCSPPGMPCGMCLETMTEFCEDLPILVVNPQGETREYRLRELHPTPFRWPQDGASDDSSTSG